ncbi:prepilin-type N-terminal cleavage/methylation domain-containing protein [bacterium]|nr:prepilin-type N-terminal cleavage/methylation domain-containing protein [bacterium]
MKNTLFKQAGFTLLEIMISVTIFGIVSIVCLNSYILSAKHISLLNENQNKNLLARWKIEELRIEAQEIEDDKGIFPQPFENYEWEISLSDLVITDTEYEVEYIPYKLKILNGKNDFEVIMPFIKTSTGESLE